MEKQGKLSQSPPTLAQVMTPPLTSSVSLGSLLTFPYLASAVVALQLSHIRHPAQQLFTLQFVTVAKVVVLKLKQNNFMVVVAAHKELY